MSRVPLPADPPPVPHLPDFTLIKLIGSGSYGDVWLARAVTGVYRAVKIVWRDRFADVRPYYREFEGVTRFAAVSLREPSQLALLHAGRNDQEGFFYYVMELADDVAQGREIDPATYVPLTLKALHARGPRLNPSEVIALGVALARALASLHQAGLVHRDIKPSNIVLIGGVPKLADVGLVAAASAGLTFVGTEGFVPPEGPGAPAADVYSLGKVLYELATGLDRQDWPRLPPDLANLPDRRALLELNEVLVRACEPDPRKRFADAGALLDELLLLQAGKSVRRLRAAERRTTRALRIAAGLAVIAAIAGAGAAIERHRAHEQLVLRERAEADRDALARQTIYAARLAQVQRAIEQDDYGRARRGLREAAPAKGEPDLRGFEWHALARLAQGDACEVVRENGPAIDVVVASPDGRLIAVHDEDRTVTLYDAATLGALRTVSGVQRLAGFSSDGRWLVGTNVTLALQRWRVEDGRPEDVTPGKATFRPLGIQGADRVIAWAYPGEADAPPGPRAPPATLLVWDFRAGAEVHRLPMGDPDEATWEYHRSAIDPAGTGIVIVTSRGRGSTQQFRLSHIRLDDRPAATHELVKDFLPSAVGVLTGESGNPTWWVAEAASGRQRIYSPTASRWEPSAKPLPVGISAQALWPVGDETVLVQAHHATLSVTNSTGSFSGVVRGHASLITSVVPSRNRSLFTASSAGEVRRWNYDSLRHGAARPCWNSRGASSQTVFSANGKTLYAPLDGATVAALALPTLERTRLIPGMRIPVGELGQDLWGISADGLALTCWDLQTNTVRREIARSAAPIASAVLAQNGKRLCFTRGNGELALVELDAGDTIHRVSASQEYLWSLTLDPTGRVLWTIGNHRRLERRTMPEGVVTWSTVMPAVTSSLCVLPNREALAVALENGDVQVHHAGTGELIYRAPSGSGAIQAITATRDGTRLVCGGIEGQIHVLDPRSGAYIAGIPLRGAGGIHNLVLSDRNEIAVLGKSGLLTYVALASGERAAR